MKWSAPYRHCIFSGHANYNGYFLLVNLLFSCLDPDTQIEVLLSGAFLVFREIFAAKMPYGQYLNWKDIKALYIPNLLFKSKIFPICCETFTYLLTLEQIYLT